MGLEKIEKAAGIVASTHRHFGDDEATALQKTVDAAKKAIAGPRKEYGIKVLVDGKVEDTLTAEGCFCLAIHAEGIDLRDLYTEEAFMAAVHRGVKTFRAEGSQSEDDR